MLMRILLVFSISCLLAGGAMAQRGGGHGGGGGVARGGGGMGFSHGGFGGGGFHGGFNNGFHGGFNNGFHNGFGWGRGFRGGFGVGYWPGYWPGYYGGYYGGYYDYPYYDSSYYAPAYSGGYGYGGGYAPNTTVVYPPQQPSMSVYVDPPVHSSLHVYDEYGQEVRGGGSGPAATSSPLYLIALQDHVIHAATSYRVDGGTLVYVTQQHEEKRVPLSSVDRALTMQLNHERHVQMNLGQ
jgi:hypothetical protein